MTSVARKKSYRSMKIPFGPNEYLIFFTAKSGNFYQSLTHLPPPPPAIPEFGQVFGPNVQKQSVTNNGDTLSIFPMEITVQWVVWDNVDGSPLVSSVNQSDDKPEELVSKLLSSDTSTDDKVETTLGNGS